MRNCLDITMIKAAPLAAGIIMATKTTKTP
jgi:hypothetical protein